VLKLSPDERWRHPGFDIDASMAAFAAFLRPSVVDGQSEVVGTPYEVAIRAIHAHRQPCKVCRPCAVARALLILWRHRAESQHPFHRMADEAIRTRAQLGKMIDCLEEFATWRHRPNMDEIRKLEGSGVLSDTLPRDTLVHSARILVLTRALHANLESLTTFPVAFDSPELREPFGKKRRRLLYGQVLDELRAGGFKVGECVDLVVDGTGETKDRQVDRARKALASWKKFSNGQ
jgi:hypothetical protein